MIYKSCEQYYDNSATPDKITDKLATTNHAVPKHYPITHKCIIS